MHPSTQNLTQNGIQNICQPAGWKLVLTENEIMFAVEKCANVINKLFDGKDIVVVCILKGAVYFFVDLTRYLTVPHSTYFIEATSYHDKQTQSACVSIMSSIEPSKFTNKDVILVDELFDNGHTMNQIKVAIHEKALVPMDKIFTCTIFKKNKITEFVPPDLYGVVVPNVWLVGYGLDDKQKCRNWKSLWACPKCEGVDNSTDDAIFEDDAYYQIVRNEILAQLE